MIRPITFIVSILLSGLLLAWLQSPGQGQRNSYIEANDSTTLANLPELKLHPGFQNTELPSEVDNSVHPFMRPVFSQTGASCGQAASVGYLFTYEMCRARNLPATESSNQFPSHFVYNFNNYNSWFGVNYRHSFEVLNKLGTPTLADYGGMAIDEDGVIWISGYEKYYEAMKNRVRRAYRINVGNQEGLLTLKHWLAHHAEGSPYGGLANFDAASPWGSGMQQLPADSPEAGKKVMAYFPLNYATHAMTIVGYNDSIRLDLNGDGLYTNHLDINNDGLVDMRDWEIGGLKFVNSYGSDWADNGYCYMLYRTLAENVYYGGIWNNQVYVAEVREVYEPKLTIRFKISHNQREQIRLVAGVSTDTSAKIPEFRMYFPVFNFQGGPNYMQGHNTHDSLKILEAGLDITPLLDHITPGQPAAIYLQIDEDDPGNMGSGQIIEYSVISYTDTSPLEHASSEVPAEIKHNDVTYLKVLATNSFSKPQIVTEEIPMYEPGHQLQANGGTEPYRWNLETPYYEQRHHNEFPQVHDFQLIPEMPNQKYARQSLPFSFPFYGESYEEVFAHVDGFLMFDPGIFPWPYYQDTYLMFRTVRNISGFMFRPVRYQPESRSDEGIWYRGDASRADFRWKQPLLFSNNQLGYAEFALSLYPDGTIEFYYNDITVDENITWYAGVSSGDLIEFQLINGSQNGFLPSGTARRLSPQKHSQGLNLSENGYLSGLDSIGNNLEYITVRATDDMGISATKTFQFSDVLTYTLTYTTADGLIPRAGSDLTISIEVTNHTAADIVSLSVEMNSTDEFVILSSDELSISSIPAGESISISNAFELSISVICPDRQQIPLELHFNNAQIDLTGLDWLRVYAPDLTLLKWQFEDDDNQYPDPGETAPVSFLIGNRGSVSAQEISLSLSTTDPYITLIDPGEFVMNTIEPGLSGQAIFNISISSQCPIDHEAIITLSYFQGDSLIKHQQISMFIGQYPVLLYNKAKNDESAQRIKQALDEMFLPYLYVESLPERLDLFRSVFVCLGSGNDYTSLTEIEGEKLAMFLDQGGRLYMEGSYAWNFSIQTQAHQKFRITGFVLNSPLTLYNIEGFSDQFAQGLSFPFNEVHDFLFIGINPLPPAFPVMHPDSDPAVNTMIANEQFDYKTVGSQLEFRNYGFEQDAEERYELLYQILSFFDMQHLITRQNEKYGPSGRSDTPAAFPNPFTDQTCFDIVPGMHNRTILTISNPQGTTVRHIQTEAGTSGYRLCWDGRNDAGIPVPKGIYFATVVGHGIYYTMKLIKN
jgi:hypothetical protein